MVLSTRASKKDDEAFYLQRFLARLPSFPEGRIEAFEEPDFLVYRSDSILGIELTELHREPPVGALPQQAREAMRQRVIERAQEIYLAENHPIARVTVFLNERTHVGKSEVEQLANQICDLAIRNLPGPNSSGEEAYDWTNRAYFPEIVDTIRVRRLDAITETHFNCPGATWVASLSRADIDRKLVAKEPKYAAYRKSCNEVWLVINADVRSMSTWFQFDSAPLSETFETSFDKVFVLSHFGDKLYELNVRLPNEVGNT